jgi:hypothetical protein
VYDARAIVTVATLRGYARVYARDSDYEIAWKTYMRNGIERTLRVRPIIEDPDKLEVEVAGLLRAQAAIKVLEKMGGVA